MATTRKGYLAYLVRLWQVELKGCTTWRAQLENAHTGESHGFVSLEELFDFLRHRIEGYGTGTDTQREHTDP